MEKINFQLPISKDDNEIVFSVEDLDFENGMAVVSVTKDVKIELFEKDRMHYPLKGSVIYNGLIDTNGEFIIPISKRNLRIDVIDSSNIIVLVEEDNQGKLLEPRYSTVHYERNNNELTLIEEWKDSEFIRASEEEISICRLVRENNTYKNTIQNYNPIKKTLIYNK